MQLFKLSWRNIWRNRRRALITIASVFFAVFFCTLMLSFQSGVWEKMIDNTLRTQTGHIQIHGKGYWNDRSIDNFMMLSDSVISSLKTIPNVTNVSPRIETFAMASFGMLSRGISVIGISPKREAEKSNLPIRLVQGEYLSETDDGVLVGEGLCRYLRVGLGDTLAFLGQGWRGSTAVGLYPIRGILRMPLTDMDNGLAYMSLSAAQEFIDMPNGYSGILIALNNDRRLNQTMEEVKAKLDTPTSKLSDFEVLSWHYTMKDLLRSAEADKAFSKIILFILYLIVGFGILGTVIMMTNERKREFAILISLGMKRGLLQLVFTIELLLMALCGVLASLVLTIPFVWWFHTHPIQLTGNMAKMYADYGMEPVMPMSADPAIFWTQIVIIFVMACITLIYPYYVIRKLKITAKE